VPELPTVGSQGDGMSGSGQDDEFAIGNGELPEEIQDVIFRRDSIEFTARDHTGTFNFVGSTKGNLVVISR